MYTVDRYFEYCKESNIGAIYYCIKVKGVDAEEIDEQIYTVYRHFDIIQSWFIQNKNAFYIACEENKPDMLCMLIDVFKVRSNQEVRQEFLGFD